MGTVRAVLLGPPGAGTGTCSRDVADSFSVERIGVGRRGRSWTEGDGADEDAERDDAVPEAVVAETVERALADTDGFVLEDYPRTRRQAASLAEVAPLDVVVSLDVSESALLDRREGYRHCVGCSAAYHTAFDPPAAAGTCQACGDELLGTVDADAVRGWLREYEATIEPVLGFYRERGVLVDVDGTGPPDAVRAAVRDTIEVFAGDA